MIPAGRYLFIVNKTTGTVVKKLAIPYTLDGKNTRIRYVAERFVNIKGTPIPLVIAVDFPNEKPGSRLAKTRYRTTVDEKTLRINEQLEPSEFSITVPAGTVVADAIKQKHYTLTAPLETLDHTDSIKRLDAMLEEARKNK